MQSHVLDALAYAEIMYRRNLINQEKDMGCDIHFTVEMKINDRWIGVYSTLYTPNMARDPKDMYTPWRSVWCANRDYHFFAAIAGVRGEWRGEGPEPNGLPEDISELAQAAVDGYGGDGHSHGHMPLLDFVRAKMRVNQDALTAVEVTHKLTKTAEELTQWPYARTLKNEYSLSDLSEYDEEDTLVRVVFFFDN